MNTSSVLMSSLSSSPLPFCKTFPPLLCVDAFVHVYLQAKEHVNGVELDGRRLRVDYSITKRPHTPTPGVYMGRPTHAGPDDREHRERDRGYDRGGRLSDDGGRNYSK